ncbi:MAG: diguanylate cyclase [Rhodocyclaceae bacterium]|nr:diguanylate cyclase [Rhodocyclaceae bacterium]
MQTAPAESGDRSELGLIRRLRFRLLFGLSLTVLAGLVATSIFYVRQAEEAILAENERSLHKVTDAVASSLESIMEGGHAEVAAEFNRRLARVGGATRFLIVRTDGRPAFRDNETIDAVNRVLGTTAFTPHGEVETELQPIPEASSPAFQEAARGTEARQLHRTGPGGEDLLVFMDPIFSREVCHRCHVGGEAVRGVVIMETSQVQVEKDMLGARFRALIGLMMALGVTMLATGYALGKTLFGPIEGVTSAMRRVSLGDWDHGVPVESDDEIGQMASNFNVMRERLKANYLNLLAEQDKLTTILLAAREAVVVTDRDGAVVLVNPAAEEILGKSVAQIHQDGFEHIVDDPEIMHCLLSGEPESGVLELDYHGRRLAVSAATICDGDGAVIGSAALIRDVDDEHRMRARLSHMARTDELTGLYNRRHLDARFAEEFDRMRSSGQALAVMMFDVDHFKRFNDTHGHEVGDQVLRQVGRVTRETLRIYDVLGRYGGEEFVAVLPGLHSGDAGPVADRLRQDVARLRIGDGLQVTISIGVACTETVDAETPDALLAAADKALYVAKRNGRNQVQVAAKTIT